MRLKEIEIRMAAISEELNAENADLTALEKEIGELKEERKALVENVEKRTALVNEVASGNLQPIKVFTEGAKMEERKFDVDSLEYRNAWLKNLQGKQLDEIEKRAYASVDTNNAVPTMVADKFFAKMKKLAPMLSEITLLRVAGNIKFSAEGTRNAAAAHTENTAVTPAADTIVTVSLGGYEFMKVIRISVSVFTMAVSAFEGWLVDMLSDDIARQIDNYIINDSTNGIAAITYSTGTNQILQTSTTGYGYADIIGLIALLPAAYDSEAKFLVNKKTLYNKIYGIVDTAGRPIFNPTENMINGYPVVVDDYVATAKNEIYLGRFTDIVGNLSQDITVAKSAESGFLNNSIDYRGTALFDSKPAKLDGIIRLVSTTA